MRSVFILVRYNVVESETGSFGHLLLGLFLVGNDMCLLESTLTSHEKYYLMSSLAAQYVNKKANITPRR